MERLPTWESVRSFVSQNGFALYKPPMNHRPIKIPAKNQTTSLNIRMYASKVDLAADNFTADPSHLDRFYSD